MDEESEHFLRDARDEKRRDLVHEIEGSSSTQDSDEPAEAAGRYAGADGMESE